MPLAGHRRGGHVFGLAFSRIKHMAHGKRYTSPTPQRPPQASPPIFICGCSPSTLLTGLSFVRAYVCNGKKWQPSLVVLICRPLGEFFARAGLLHSCKRDAFARVGLLHVLQVRSLCNELACFMYCKCDAFARIDLLHVYYKRDAFARVGLLHSCKRDAFARVDLLYVLQVRCLCTN